MGFFTGCVLATIGGWVLFFVTDGARFVGMLKLFSNNTADPEFIAGVCSDSISSCFHVAWYHYWFVLALILGALLVALTKNDSE